MASTRRQFSGTGTRSLSPPPSASPEIELRLSPRVSSRKLNALFATAWPGHEARDFRSVLRRSLTYVCAYAGGALVGFVNVAWDGGLHAFILDTTVRASHQHRGIGMALVAEAANAAKARGVEWLHVDFEEELLPFYQRCGFRPTEAALINLREAWPPRLDTWLQSTSSGPG